jgi:uncharacterized MAPEG superfamily protein
MIPFFIPVFCDSILPSSFVHTAVSFLPNSFTSLIASPTWALYYGLLAVMLPCGMKIGYSIAKTDPADAGKQNANPRPHGARLAATDPMFARLCAAEAHQFENSAFFFTAVLAAMHNNVDASFITAYSTFWIATRILHTVTYVSAWGGITVPVGVIRTFMYAASSAACASILLAAARKSTE